MSLSSLLQRIDIMDLNLKLARLEKPKQLINVELELLALLNISKERRSCDRNTLRGQLAKP